MTTLTSDHKTHRVVATVPPQVRWAAFHSAARGAICSSSLLADYHWIIDDQGPMDDVNLDEMVRSGEVFRSHAARSPKQLATVVVTTDRSFDLWARVIDEHYGGRKHYAAPSLAAAHRLLDRLDADHRSERV